MNNFKERMRMQQHIIDKQDKKITQLQQEIDRIKEVAIKNSMDNFNLQKELLHLKSLGLFARIFKKWD